MISIYWKDMHYLATKRIIARSKRLRDNYPEDVIIIIPAQRKRKRSKVSMRLGYYNPSINAKGLSLKRERERTKFFFPHRRSLLRFVLFLYEHRLRRHLLHSRPPSLYLVSWVWKTLNGFLMTLKGRAQRDERGKSVGRAKAREREKQQLIPATLRRLSDDWWRLRLLGRDEQETLSKSLMRSIPKLRLRGTRVCDVGYSCYG